MLFSSKCLNRLPGRPLPITPLIWLLAGSLQAPGALPENLGNWSPVVRAAASTRAAQAGPAALPELLVALDSDNAGMRHAATRSIAIIANASKERKTDDWQGITTKLISIVNQDKDFWTRCGAAAALQAIRAKAAAPALIKAADDHNPWVAAAAVDAVSGLPLDFFDREQYLATALKALAAPRSETRSSGMKMLGVLGPDARTALPQVEASIATYSQDSMFADRPRIEAIIWISRFDRRRAAAFANGLLLEERWGASGRYAKLVPFLGTLGKDAAPATEGLKRAAAQTKAKDKGTAAKAKQILAKLKS